MFVAMIIDVARISTIVASNSKRTSQYVPVLSWFTYDPQTLNVRIAKCGNIYKVGPPGDGLVY